MGKMEQRNFERRNFERRNFNKIIMQTWKDDDGNFSFRYLYYVYLMYGDEYFQREFGYDLKRKYSHFFSNQHEPFYQSQKQDMIIVHDVVEYMKYLQEYHISLIERIKDNPDMYPYDTYSVLNYPLEKCFSDVEKFYRYDVRCQNQPRQ